VRGDIALSVRRLNTRYDLSRLLEITFQGLGGILFLLCPLGLDKHNGQDIRNKMNQIEPFNPVENSIT